MKIVFPGISKTFNTSDSKVHSLVIENQKLMVEILTDLTNQFEGKDGKIVVSENNKILAMSKHCELLCQFVPFSINTKSLISKVSTALEKEGVKSDEYDKTMETFSELEIFFADLAFKLPGNIVFSKLNLPAVIKAVGPCFVEDYDNLGEKILDYFELVEDYEQTKLFITLNLRSYINDQEMELFLQEITKRNINLFMLENCERKLLKNENRYIIDSDLCEIC